MDVIQTSQAPKQITSESEWYIRHSIQTLYHQSRDHVYVRVLEHGNTNLDDEARWIGDVFATVWYDTSKETPVEMRYDTEDGCGIRIGRFCVDMPPGALAAIVHAWVEYHDSTV